MILLSMLNIPPSPGKHVFILHRGRNINPFQLLGIDSVSYENGVRPQYSRTVVEIMGGWKKVIVQPWTLSAIKIKTGLRGGDMAYLGGCFD
jgi:hypothetical protein